MPLDWLNKPIETSVGDMLARKKRARAIAALKVRLEGLQGASTSTQTRLQLADLLVLAGRAREAVPILLGLADEFTKDGFAAKAVAVLKRVERIEPGRPDVEARLSALVHQRHRATPAAPAPPSARRRLPEFGMEEIDEEAELATDDTATAATAPESSAGEDVREDVAPESAPREAAGPGATAEEVAPSSEEASSRVRSVFRRFLASLGTGEEAAPTGEVASAPAADDVTAKAAAEAGTDAVAEPPPPTPEAKEEGASPVAEVREVEAEEPAAAVPKEDEPTAAPVTNPAAEAQAPAEPAPLTGKIKGIFRRFLASMAGGPEEGPPHAEAPAPKEAPALHERATPAVETATPEGAPPTAAPPAVETPAPPEPPEAPSEDEELWVEPEPAETTPILAEVPPETSQEQVLDLIEDVLRHPPAAAPAAPAAEAAAPDPAALAASAGALAASPLFRDLSEDERLAVVRGMHLRGFEAGSIVVTEDEPGQSLFLVTTGSVKVFVRNPEGRNLEVGLIGEGAFLGEISSLSGRPRTATVTAASRCELLELDKATVDGIARTHPRVREALEALYILRASSPEAAAIRAVPLGDARTREQAMLILEAHFGESRWDPRMRLRLAEVLLKAGKERDAIPVLVGLADDLAREGFTEKAIAILKKIERLQRRHIEEINLAPRRKAAPAPTPPIPPPSPPSAAVAEKPPARGRRKPKTAGFFDNWIVDVVRDSLRQKPAAAEEVPARPGDPARISGYARGLRASPLFEDFSEDELLILIQKLRLLSYEPGDVIITEGEPGQSLFVLAAGTVRVFVRNPVGRNVELTTLPEGAFFGEISTLSNRPRTATITAAAPCELLELDRAALDAVIAAHPRVRTVLEEFYIERAASPDAEAIRSAPPAESPSS